MLEYLFVVAKLRSPILGYNHNIRHGARMFHVQTEDLGIRSPQIHSHLFHEGVIIATKKLRYDAEADADIVKSLMQAQHKALLRELRSGQYDDRIVQYLGPAALEETEDTLIDVTPSGEHLLTSGERLLLEDAAAHAAPAARQDAPRHASESALANQSPAFPTVQPDAQAVFGEIGEQIGSTAPLQQSPPSGVPAATATVFDSTVPTATHALGGSQENQPGIRSEAGRVSKATVRDSLPPLFSEKISPSTGLQRGRLGEASTPFELTDRIATTSSSGEQTILDMPVIDLASLAADVPREQPWPADGLPLAAAPVTFAKPAPSHAEPPDPNRAPAREGAAVFSRPAAAPPDNSPPPLGTRWVARPDRRERPFAHSGGFPVVNPPDTSEGQPKTSSHSQSPSQPAQVPQPVKPVQPAQAATPTRPSGRFRAPSDTLIIEPASRKRSSTPPLGNKVPAESQGRQAQPPGWPSNNRTYIPLDNRPAYPNTPSTPNAVNPNSPGAPNAPNAPIAANAAPNAGLNAERFKPQHQPSSFAIPPGQQSAAGLPIDHRSLAVDHRQSALGGRTLTPWTPAPAQSPNASSDAAPPPRHPPEQPRPQQQPQQRPQQQPQQRPQQQPQQRGAADSGHLHSHPNHGERVIVARPAIMVGAPSTPAAPDRERAKTSAATPHHPGGATPARPPTTANAAAREKPAKLDSEHFAPPQSIFGQDLISEKSLDEVIMAYLSDDAKEK
ncbi:MAG: hypothetical protein V2A73_08135 [Pseudomonadota bacterium]